MALTVPTVTGYSAFYELTGDKIPYTPTSVAQKGMRSPLERQITKLFRRNQLRDVVAAALALNGAAAGAGTASSTYKRVQVPDGPALSTPQVTNIDDFQGNRSIETVTVINRTTTADDETYIDTLYSTALLEAGITYPTVVGSGGPAYKGNQGVPGFAA